MGDEVLVALDHVLPVLCGQVGVFDDRGLDLGLFDDFLEPVMIDAKHDGAEHLDEAAVGIPGEAGVIGGERQARDGGVVQAEVQHRVHHAGHRHPRAGADGDQQRLFGVAEGEADGFFHQGQGGVDLRGQLAGVLAAIGVEGRAELGRDGEARRDRQANAGHFGQVGALPAQEIAHIRPALIEAGTEAVNPLCHGNPAQPSIREKSATRSMVARTRCSNRSRLRRNSGSGAFTVTSLKNASNGARRPAMPAMAPA